MVLQTPQEIQSAIYPSVVISALCHVSVISLPVVGCPSGLGLCLSGPCWPAERCCREMAAHVCEEEATSVGKGRRTSTYSWILYLLYVLLFLCLSFGWDKEADPLPPSHLIPTILSCHSRTRPPSLQPLVFLFPPAAFSSLYLIYPLSPLNPGCPSVLLISNLIHLAHF